VSLAYFDFPSGSVNTGLKVRWLDCLRRIYLFSVYLRTLTVAQIVSGVQSAG
jgi:hypothetical protein